MPDQQIGGGDDYYGDGGDGGGNDYYGDGDDDHADRLVIAFPKGASATIEVEGVDSEILAPAGSVIVLDEDEVVDLPGGLQVLPGATGTLVYPEGEHQFTTGGTLWPPDGGIISLGGGHQVRGGVVVPSGSTVRVFYV